MSKQFDPSQLLAIFSAEAQDHIQTLTQGILTLEKSPGNKKVIHELFRAAHSLKGAAATVGFDDISKVAHRMEDVLSAIRDGKSRFQKKTADGIFVGLDTIRDILQEMASGQKRRRDLKSVLEIVSGVKSTGKKNRKKINGAQAKREKTVTAVSSEVVPSEDKGGGAAKGEKAGYLEEFIRVPVKKINTLLNLGGELVINKIKTNQKVTSFKRSIRMAKDMHKRLASLGEQVRSVDDAEVRTRLIESLQSCDADTSVIKDELVKLYDEVMGEAVRIDPIVDELQQQIKKIRMLPCSNLFVAFPRVVRDIAVNQSKEVQLKIEGEETELDKKVLEEIKEPLIHALRNAVDHGIEPPEEREAAGKPRQATIGLCAYYRGANVILEITDDGRGIDRERIKQVALKKGLKTQEEIGALSDKEALGLIFLPGFSTSEFITDVSGRGVGMDVLKQQVDHLKGNIEIFSEMGQGTTIRLELPLTIAIIHVVLIVTGEKTFALPLAGVEEVIKVYSKELSSVENRMAIEHRGQTLPVVRMDHILGIPSSDNGSLMENGLMDVVILNSIFGRVGFIVDSLRGKEEIYIKNIGAHTGKLRNVSGATMLGTGEVIVILDPGDLVMSSREIRAPGKSDRKAAAKTQRQKKILVVEDSMTTRDVMQALLENEGYLVEAAIDGIDAMEQLSHTRFDLIVSDIEMPRMTGIELCKTVKEHDKYKDIPFVFVTALAKEEEKRRGIEVGAQAYIVKTSFDQSNLLSAVARLIG